MSTSASRPASTTGHPTTTSSGAVTGGPGVRRRRRSTIAVSPHADGSGNAGTALSPSRNTGPALNPRPHADGSGNAGTALSPSRNTGPALNPRPHAGPHPTPSPSPGTAAAVLQPLVDRMFGRLGKRLPLNVRFWDGSVLPAGDPTAPTAIVRAPEALTHILRSPGELGIARPWVLGLLDLDGDIEEALRRGQDARGLQFTTRDKLDALRAAVKLGALRPAPLPEAEAKVHGSRHEAERDAESVQYHYDISNDFYRLVLGPSLVYSCAYWDGTESDTLEAAQARKLDLICRKLRLQPGERFLDVGCGWGSLVLHAAERYGVQAVGVTASKEQAALARERVREAGLGDRIEIRIQDYRDVPDGPFDKIASVGMYEHVGERSLPIYAAKLYGLLRPGGLLLNHGITRLHDGEQRRASFTDRYVFPDGELHRLAVVCEMLETAGFEVRDVESLREHYARTLRAWSSNLAAHQADAVAEVGFQRERVWRLYMASAAVLFDVGHISIVQTLAAKPGAPHGLPATRAELLEARP